MRSLALAGLLWAAALVLVVWAWPARAQEMQPHEGTGAAIGSITVTNRVTATVHARQVHTFDGVEVVVVYESTPNYTPGVDPRDIVTVTVPDGYVAVPSDALIPEGEAVEIVIYEALLG